MNMSSTRVVIYVLSSVKETKLSFNLGERLCVYPLWM